ncbi:hypothetical protein HF888_10560 [Bermanella marisrubri]|uniref:GluG n=1 Tax=Bermanella marisrubri TaxID=207949 RepID=Q1N5S2_9GAMM|nr:hypothetical protein [Bermanella marisrubri]EAT13870.1 GluG [Oceanobacter sp. RED65] [Bermanella marisrubri]QIZ84630.1 hypothetical protein HF888_10560 [Bermanella marisrubri]
MKAHIKLSIIKRIYVFLACLTSNFVHLALTSSITLFSFNVSASNDTLVDRDGDGLIDINTIEDLNAMRVSLEQSDLEFMLYGSMKGCPEKQCVGYELNANLDFDDNNDGKFDSNDSYWNAGEGWKPIQLINKRTVVFNGNSHEIRNLVINRKDYRNQVAGLFGKVNSLEISNLKLTDFYIQSRYSAGSIIGESLGHVSISNVHVNGEIIGPSYAGGLIGAHNSKYGSVPRSVDIDGVSINVQLFSTGDMGGVIGSVDSKASIRNAYIMVMAKGTGYFGGIVSKQIGKAGVSVNSAIVLAAKDPNVTGFALAYSHYKVNVEHSVIQTNFINSFDEVYLNLGINISEEESWISPESSVDSVVVLTEEDEKLIQHHVGANRFDSTNIKGLSRTKFIPNIKILGTWYRDSDKDGYFDRYDQWPFNAARAIDLDRDGYTEKVIPSFFVINIGTPKTQKKPFAVDQFPKNPFAAIDEDFDGLPDQWVKTCGNICQKQFSLTLDEHLFDFDNDGIVDTDDIDADGDGKEDMDSNSNGLIEIRTSQELVDFLKHDPFGFGTGLRRVSEKKAASGCPFKTIGRRTRRQCHGYELVNDIEFPIGKGVLVNWEQIKSFGAVLDGNGYSVKGIRQMHSPEDDESNFNIGLFQQMQRAEIRNINFENGLFYGEQNHAHGVLASSIQLSKIVNVSFEARTLHTARDKSEIHIPSFKGLVGNVIDSDVIGLSFEGVIDTSARVVNGLIGRSENSNIEDISLIARVVKTGCQTVNAFGSNLSKTIISNAWVAMDLIEDENGGCDNSVHIVSKEINSTNLSHFVASFRSNRQDQIFDYFSSAKGEVGLSNGLVITGHKLASIPKSMTSNLNISIDSIGELIAKKEDIKFQQLALVRKNYEAPLEFTRKSVVCDEVDCIEELFSAEFLDVIEWNSGKNTVKPKLLLGNIEYKDTDLDGFPNHLDMAPRDVNFSIDRDRDMVFDYFNSACDEECKRSISMPVDQLPDLPFASLDNDKDGLADAWNSNCDSDCQRLNIKYLDNYVDDFDNDGIPDSNDNDWDNNGKDDADADHNGLIDVNSLDDFSAIRFSPSGSSKKVSKDAKRDFSGCRPLNRHGVFTSRCVGYELKKNLDFDTNANNKVDPEDQFYHEDRERGRLTNWSPVYEFNTFSSVLEGNNFELRNLFINDDSTHRSLFNSLHNAKIKNLTLRGSLNRIHSEDPSFLASKIKGSELNNVHIEGGLRVYKGHGQGFAEDIIHSKFDNVSFNGIIVGEMNKVSSINGIARWAKLSEFNNIKIEGYFHGAKAVAGLFGSMASADVMNADIDGVFHGFDQAAGLVERMSSDSMIRNAAIRGDIHSQGDAAGVARYIFRNNILENIIVLASIQGEMSVGGVVAEISSSDNLLLNVSSRGTIRGFGEVGGIVGLVDNQDGNRIIGCSVSSEISGRQYVGGVVGRAGTLDIIGCDSMANVAGYIYVGGISGGHFGGLISNSRSEGSIRGVDSVGGLAGFVGFKDISMKLQRNYVTGNIIGDKFSDALIGFKNGSLESINNFWAIDTTNQLESVGSSDTSFGVLQEHLKCTGTSSAHCTNADAISVDNYISIPWGHSINIEDLGQYKVKVGWDFGNSVSLPVPRVEYIKRDVRPQ